MKVKVFLSRYGFLLGITLFLVGAALAEFFENLWIWALFILIGFIIAVRADPPIPPIRYKWACKKCEHQANRIEKYCTKCGSLMESKKMIQYKICKNDHRIEDKHEVYKFCPVCGKPLKEEEFLISETEKELSKAK